MFVLSLKQRAHNRGGANRHQLRVYHHTFQKEEEEEEEVQFQVKSAISSHTNSTV